MVPANADPRSTPGSGEDTVLAALIAWRKARQQADPTALRGLKETHLRTIVSTESWTEEAIRPHLPGELKVIAPQLAEEVARARRQGDGSASHSTGSAGQATNGVAGRPADGPTLSAFSAPTSPPASSPFGPPASSPSAPNDPSPSKPPLSSPSSSLFGPPASSTPAAPESHVTPPASEPEFSPPEKATAQSAPPSAPAPESVPAPAVTDLATLKLADYGYAPLPERPVSIRVAPTPGGVQLRWPELDMGRSVVLYRVVATDDFAPERPQEAREVARTTEANCLDTQAFENPLRHVQVWCHVGADLVAAAAAEPVLHAHTEMIAPVQNAHVQFEDGEVQGDWYVLGEAVGVQILRVPVERVGDPDADSLDYQILGDQKNLRGFSDDSVKRGKGYEYRIFVKMRVGGRIRLSEPVKFQVRVPIQLTAVTDLQVIPQPEAGSYDLMWTPPVTGHVQIYRTEKPLGITVSETDEQYRLARFGEDGPDGRVIVRRVKLPVDWTLGYFTPVTVLGAERLVGTAGRGVRLPAVKDVHLVERTVRQVLTFSWPEGADAVQAFVAPRGSGTDSEQEQDDLRASSLSGDPNETVSEEEYRATGGLYFKGELPTDGCLVHVRPVTGFYPDRFPGPPATVEYPGILRLKYLINAEFDATGRKQTLYVQIQGERDYLHRLPFTMVHDPTRLPLHQKDGTPLPAEPVAGAQGVGGAQFRPEAVLKEPGATCWKISVNGLSGFVRLFVGKRPDSAGAPIALFDPELPDLRLGPYR